MSKKSLEQLEQERGVLLLGDVDLSEQFTDDEFTEIMTTGSRQYIGIDHESRIEFLQANGHEVTRENMTDTTLSARMPDLEADDAAEESA